MDDQFSTYAISADGMTLAVGASGEGSSATGVNGDQANDDAPGSGAVYIFTRTGTTWSQQAYLKASNTGMGDGFGVGVSLSSDGSTLAVGAWHEASSATGVDGDQTNDDAPHSGAVYVFTRASSTWSQQAYIKPSDTTKGSTFGRMVSLSSDGSTLAVGARGEFSGTSGAAYVFTRTDGRWSEQARLQAASPRPDDLFGTAVSLSRDGATLAIGALGDASSATGIDGDPTNTDVPDSGAVYVFTRRSSDWSQEAYIKASNTDVYELFGASVSLSGDGATLAVGAPFESSSATGIGGDQSNNDAPSSGAVYVFVRAGARWSQEAYIKASNTGEQDGFGDVSLSADGSILAVGAPREGSNATGYDGDQTNNDAPNSGAVYVFMRTGTTWSQEAYIKAPNTGMDDGFGEPVALCGAGSTLVVGAYGEDSGTTGVGGDQTNESVMDSGAVYVY